MTTAATVEWGQRRPSLLGPDGLPLSRPAPKNVPAPLRSNADPVTERIEDFNGGFRIHTEQLCDDTLQAVHDAGDLIPRRTKADGARYVGSVPVVQGLIWAKECGFAMGTREWAEYARKKMETGGFSKLKATLK